jgi:indolepyruvate ferredoxin oxidoreductase alpha subunit
VFYVLHQLISPRKGHHAGVPQTQGEDADKAEERHLPGLVVTGDIGCYTLGALRPLSAIDTCSCMGASIGHAVGMEKAGVENKVVAVIGDSTFYHSGITGLVDVITSGAATTVVILDNLTTAMTGGNTNPGSGASVSGKPARRVDLEALCRGLGVEDVQVVNAYDIDEIRRQLVRAIQSSEPSVLIVRAPCVLQQRIAHPQASWVDAEKCTGCSACLLTGCPALIRKGNKVEIVARLCTGCQVCNQVCPHDAILLVEREGAKP